MERPFIPCVSGLRNSTLQYTEELQRRIKELSEKYEALRCSAKGTSDAQTQTLEEQMVIDSATIPLVLESGNSFCSIP